MQKLAYFAGSSRSDCKCMLSVTSISGLIPHALTFFALALALAVYPVWPAPLPWAGAAYAVLALTQADFTAAQAAEILAPYTAAHGAPAETLHLQTADGACLAPNE